MWIMANVVTSYRAMIFAIVLQGVSADQVGFGQAFGEAPIPQACAKEVTPTTGKPYLFPPRGHLQYGLSLRPGPLRNNVPLAIWVSNTTDQEVAIMTCEDLGYFFVDGFDLLDQEGIRVLSNVEKAQAGGKYLRQCLRNIAIPIPPHSCVHGDFEKPNFDFVKDLSVYYALHPGRYVITPRLLKHGERPPTLGLAFEVAP